MCSCRGSMDLFFFFNQEEFRDQEARAKPRHDGLCCNSSPWKTEAGSSPWVRGQPGYIVSSSSTEAYKNCLKKEKVLLYNNRNIFLVILTCSFEASYFATCVLPHLFLNCWKLLIYFWPRLTYRTLGPRHLLPPGGREYH